MFNTSEIYKAQTAASTIRRPKSKIIVGGVTYTGEAALVSYPKITHTAEKMIGEFPSKACEFEIYNLSGSLSLNGQEVEVYRGLEFNGTTEWVPMGIFAASAENITNNLTKRTISFKGCDRAKLFDVPFSGNITYPCTLLSFVQQLCDGHGVTLETPNFPLSSRMLLSAPNAPRGVSERELIARVAELGGCLAQISRSGGLVISQPQPTGARVKKRLYKAVSKEPVFGPVTAVVLGHQSRTDDIVYPESATAANVSWRIEDNPFVDGAIAAADGVSPTSRQTLIEDVAANIIGKSIIPFSVTDFVDDFVFDLNDSVQVEDKTGSVFETVILSLSTASRIKSGLGAKAQSSGSTDYVKAGSVREEIRRVSLSVDHQNGKITALAEDFDELGRTTSAAIEAMAGQIRVTVTKDELSSAIEQLNNSVNFKFENLAAPKSLSNTATNISAEGIKVFNGKIEIYKGATNQTEKVFGVGTNGVLEFKGKITTESGDFYAILSAGDLSLYNKSNQLLGRFGVGSIGNRDCIAVDITKNYPSFDIIAQNDDNTFTPRITVFRKSSDNTYTGEYQTPIRVEGNIYCKNSIILENAQCVYGMYNGSREILVQKSSSGNTVIGNANQSGNTHIYTKPGGYINFFDSSTTKLFEFEKLWGYPSINFISYVTENNKEVMKKCHLYAENEGLIFINTSGKVFYITQDLNTVLSDIESLSNRVAVLEK